MKMEVIFRGDPIEVERSKAGKGGLSRTVLEAWGFTFPLGEAVDVSRASAALQAKLAKNPHFEVVAEDDAPAAAAEAAPAPASARGTKRGTVKAAKE